MLLALVVDAGAGTRRYTLSFALLKIWFAASDINLYIFLKRYHTYSILGRWCV